ncbi:hypothetical protein Hanom_Chr16g01491201 [Helianthus anomalus]
MIVEDVLGGVCFFRCKRSAVCGPHLHTSAREEVDQTSAVCMKKTVCFVLTSHLKYKNNLVCKFIKKIICHCPLYVLYI